MSRIWPFTRKLGAIDMEHPTPEQVKQARENAGLSQSEAAAMVHRANYQRWHEWEAGIRNMPLDTWELFLIKTGQLKVKKFTAPHKQK